MFYLFTCLELMMTWTAHGTNNRVVYSSDRGMNLWHITKILQDRHGFMWISSWEGLTRFDGYSFVTFKSRAGDGSPLLSNRIRDIVLSPDNDIYCMVDERWFLFRQKEGLFAQVSDAVNRELTTQKQKHKEAAKAKKASEKSKRRMTDRQGNVWEVTGDSIVMTFRTPDKARAWSLAKPSQVRCLLVDNAGNYWLTTKEDKTVCLYDKTNRLLGYLTPQGTLSQGYTPFSSSVYSILQTDRDSYWLGTKPDGLYRLQRRGATFCVEHVSLGNAQANSIYDIKKDRNGRLWLATFDGIYCMDRGKTEQVNQSAGWRVRNLHITQGNILLGATTMGLAIGKMPTGDVSSMKMNLHTRDRYRKNSLSNSSTMDILELPAGRIFVSTESGGVNRIESRNLLGKTLSFQHYGSNDGMSTESVVAMASWHGDWIWVVGGNCLMMLNTRTRDVRNFDKPFFQTTFRYSDAHPVRLPDGRWLFGLQNGAYTLAEHSLATGDSMLCPYITGISVEYGPMQYAIGHKDCLVLDASQRNMQVDFSALYFNSPDAVRYAFRLHSDEPWIHIGRQHTVTLPDMGPGDYELQLMCCGPDGTWSKRIKTLYIHVTPKFSETLWARILEVLLLLTVTLGAVYVFLYIRNIKRKQHETLQAYLALLEKDKGREECMDAENSPAVQIVSNEEDDQMMKRIMQFVESHIADAEIGIAEMADAAAVSRSGLNRKMKKIVGVTPAEFLRETRIKHAQHLLLTTQTGVSEIAYACGFTDPKYFGKTFKAMTDMSPTEFRLKGGKVL